MKCINKKKRTELIRILYKVVNKNGLQIPGLRTLLVDYGSDP